MQKDNADKIMKTVFKKNVGKSYIQLQFNKSNKKPQNDQDKQQQIQIEKNIDFNSAVLSRKSFFNKPMITLRKQGYLYNTTGSNGIFACFCGGRRAEQVLLENRVLTIKDKDGVIIETVNFDTASVQIKSSTNSIRIKIKQSQKQIYLESTHNQNVNEWEQQIRKAIEGSKGQMYQLNYITSVPKFWEKLSIGAYEFSSSCNSGDIILFKSNHGMAKFQRGVTGSDYDHIALVIKNVKDQILLFESNSDSGVAITFWKDMTRFKWYQGAEKIVYRELRNVQRDENFMSTLQGFVADNLDKKFDIGIGKLMKFTSKLAPTKQQVQDRTYFCSELVAKAYKQLGLLEMQKSSTQYWPGNFSQDKTLCLLKGQLGPQKIICFDRQLCKNK